jgi:hypothetical protein
MRILFEGILRRIDGQINARKFPETKIVLTAP